MSPQIFLYIDNVAELLGKTVQAINAHIARKDYHVVPKPGKLGQRLVWLPEQFEELKRSIFSTPPEPPLPSPLPSEIAPRRRGRPRKGVRNG
jgi:predicted DNA-binding transcriptional regulator AlpA